MNIATLYALAGAILIPLAAAAFVLRAHPLRKLLAFNIMGGGIFLVLLGTSPGNTSTAADPIAQALVLTGIVVAVAATALGLALLRRLHALTGSIDPDQNGSGT